MLTTVQQLSGIPGAFSPGERTLLLVDDDKAYTTRLARALGGKGYEVEVAEGVENALERIASVPPAFLVTEQRLKGGNGLDVVSELARRRPDARGMILTGYGNIASAVQAVRAGAHDYLAKPSDAEQIDASFSVGEELVRPAIPENPMSADRIRWEHIQRIYELCGHNVSETARRLRMHRRTLQRIMGKRAPR